MSGMTPAQIEKTVHAWIDEHWNPDLSLVEWRNILLEGGWATPHWPSNYFGRDFTIEESAIVARVLNARGVVPVAQTGPRRLAAETILLNSTISVSDNRFRTTWCHRELA